MRVEIQACLAAVTGSHNGFIFPVALIGELGQRRRFRKKNPSVFAIDFFFLNVVHDALDRLREAGSDSLSLTLSLASVDHMLDPNKF